MGFTIEDALREFKKNYKMTLLAGSDGCSNAMTWVQMVEDKTILQQLWGKNLLNYWSRISKSRKAQRIY